MKSIYNETELELISVALPAETESYTPIPHKLIIDNTFEELEKRGLNIVSKSFSINASGNRVIAYYGIQTNDTELNMMIGWRNSYDKSMSAGYVVGASVKICSNGMISGDLKVIRKHTGEADSDVIEKLIICMDHLEEEFNKIKEDVVRLKSYELTQSRMCEIIGRLFLEKDLINSTQINIIKRELEEPTFKYTNECNTMWDLYNYVTFALKTTSAIDSARIYSKVHEFFINEITPKDENSTDNTTSEITQ